MNQAQTFAPEYDDADNGGTGLIGMALVVARNKRLVIGFPFAVAVLSAALSLALPNVYKATTRLLPPQQSQSGAAALLSQLGGMAGAAAGLAGVKNPNDMYIGMLRSRTVADRLIAQFDLKKVYSTESQERARKYLEFNTMIVSGKDGLITIDVEDENQALVARLANAYVTELVKLSKGLALTEAAQRRVFFEAQLETAKNNLATAETALRRGIQTGGVISVDAESRGVLETVGRVRAQVSAKEIELSSMKAFVTENNPSYRRVQEELSSLRAELAKLENGRGAAAGQTGGQHAGLANIKLLRDVKYYEMLYELLAKQYEFSRLEEAKDPSIIQVLDPAIAPERKFKPKRMFIVLLATAFAFFGALAWAFVRDAKQRALRSQRVAQQWAELKSHLRFK